nr:hypothetical protein [Tanacetum cinerariifolium]
MSSDVHSSEDACTDDEDNDFLVDEEIEIVEPDVDVHLFGIRMDVPFDNIGVTNLVLDDVLEGEDVDVINLNSFNVDPRNDNETSNYKRRILVELSREMEGFMNAIGQWKRNLKLYKNDNVRVRASCDGKVLVFTMSQELHVSMSKAFKAKAKAKREIRGYYILQCLMLRDYVVELESTNPNTTVKILVKRNNDPSFPTRVL